jgi:Lrp/AsnC family transcriptional regulator, leucine-responsive regulatory protein
MSFTKHEKEIIKLLLENGRMTDMDIAGKLKISAQAVGRTRKKLEDNGVIEGYSCSLNFEKMGINIFCLCLIQLKNKFYKDKKNHEAIKFLKNIPAVISSCMPSTSEISVISIYGFRDAKEMERYCYLIKSQMYEYIEFIGIYPFSPGNFIKNSPNQLISLILGDKPNVPTSFEE